VVVLEELVERQAAHAAATHLSAAQQAAADHAERSRNKQKVMNENTNKTKAAIVTGASSGMGLGITRALVERGYGVVANSRNLSKSRALKSCANLVLVDGDIGQKETAIKVAEAAVKHFGRIDLLVNCAGIYMPKPFTEYAPEDFRAMISTNVAGIFS
jgi:NAD(P)-dependent dehydrogenase (short-subunit alcohol dehydrogenase family)